MNLDYNQAEYPVPYKLDGFLFSSIFSEIFSQFLSLLTLYTPVINAYT